MKNTYPIVLTPIEEGYTVYVPDFGVITQGSTLVEGIKMARDAIRVTGINLVNEKKRIPEAITLSKVVLADGDILALVDIDFAEF